VETWKLIGVQLFGIFSPPEQPYGTLAYDAWIRKKCIIGWRF